MSCAYSHKCGRCNRIIAQEKREEEREAERAERKREKRRRKKGGRWSIYAAVIIAGIMAVSVVNKNIQPTQETTQQQGVSK